MAEGMAKGMAKGMAEGMVQGEAKGRTEERMENARKMKAKGYVISDIAEITGLTEAEISKL